MHGGKLKSEKVKKANVQRSKDLLEQSCYTPDLDESVLKRGETRLVEIGTGPPSPSYTIALAA
jgi:hypothetical protein